MKCCICVLLGRRRIYFLFFIFNCFCRISHSEGFQFRAAKVKTNRFTWGRTEHVTFSAWLSHRFHTLFLYQSFVSNLSEVWITESSALCLFWRICASRQINYQWHKSCSGKAEAVCCPLAKYLKQSSEKCSTLWPKTEVVSHADHKRPFWKIWKVSCLWLTFLWVMGSVFQCFRLLSPWDFLIGTTV